MKDCEALNEIKQVQDDSRKETKELLLSEMFLKTKMKSNNAGESGILSQAHHVVTWRGSDGARPGLLFELLRQGFCPTQRVLGLQPPIGTEGGQGRTPVPPELLLGSRRRLPPR